MDGEFAVADAQIGFGAGSVGGRCSALRTDGGPGAGTRPM
jgi:hypothetical protein